nr:hypothetical protein [uncultured Pseudomonas sp.]
MAKIKKKLTTAQKRAKRVAKAERQKKYQWIFINGKQVRVKRPTTIGGMDVDEFIQRKADPILLHQNEMWEYMEDEESAALTYSEEENYQNGGKDDQLPF